MKENSWDIDYMEWMFFKKKKNQSFWIMLEIDSLWVSQNLPVTLKQAGMEGKPTWTWTEVSDLWLQDWLIVTYQNGFCSRFEEPHQACLISVTVKEADIGSKSCWQGRLHFISRSDGCLESCRVTARGRVLGIGVWLCFICCPLQGGSNLQPTHEPVNPKHVLFELKP